MPWTNKKLLLYISVLVPFVLAFTNKYTTHKVSNSRVRDFKFHSSTRYSFSSSPLFSDTFNRDSEFGPITSFIDHDRLVSPANQQAPPCDDHDAESILSTLAFTSVVVSLLNGEHTNMADIRVKSKILGICSRGMDLFSIFTIEPIVIRLSSLIGRIFAVVSDYLPDHAIQPDEVLFQGCMLGLSTMLLSKSFFPYAQAKLNQMNGVPAGSWRHPVAYKYLFRPVGITPLQFECISSLVGMKWEYYKPGETVLSATDSENDHLVWIYRGDTHIIFNGEALPYTRMPTGSHQSVSSMHFLADMDVMSDIESMISGDSYTVFIDECSVDSSGVCQPLAVVAGLSGARVLKVNKKDMYSLLKTNNDMVRHVQSLMSRGVQWKLTALLSSNSSR